MKKLCLVLLLSLVGCSGAKPAPETKETQQAVETNPLDNVPLVELKTFFGNPERAAVTLSPDGKWIAWLAPVNGVLNVFVGPSNDISKAEPVTDDKVRGIRIYRWAFDGKHLLYAQDTGGDENWHVYAVNIAEKTVKDLTPFEKVQARITKLSPEKPDHVVVAINDRDAKYHELYQIELATGKSKRIAENKRFTSFDVDKKFNVKLAHEPQPNGDFKVYRKKKRKWVEYTTIPSDDNITTYFAGFKDDKTAYIVDSRDRNTSAFGTIDITKKSNVTVLFASPKSDIQGLLRHPKTGLVQAAMHNYTKPEWEIVDPAIEGHLKKLYQVAEGSGFSIGTRTLDDSKWLVTISSDVKPHAYNLYDTATKEMTFLFYARPEMAEVPLAKMHPVEIKSSDGLTLVSYLTLPTYVEGMKPDKPLPMLLWVHGGPWGRDTWGYNSIHQWMANRGYAVLSVNFRASTGFGKDFVNAGDLEWGKKAHQDLIDAVNWAIDEGIADKDRIAIGGGSYGGYATLAGLTMTPDVFACGVDIVGPSNLVTLINSIPPYWAPLKALFAKRVGDIDTEDGKKLLKDRSPLTHVANIKKPLLIGQGKNDPRVKEAESQQIVDAMKAKGLPVTYVLFPDEGHGFARPENRLSFFAVMEKFLAQHIGGRAQSLPEKFENSSIQVPSGADQIGGLSTRLGEK